MKDNDLSIVNKYRLPLMGFAALWIYLYHEQAYEWCHVYFSPQILSRSAYFIKRIGFCGVDIFLFLSGMGLVFAKEKHNTAEFYKRRIERVFIPYLLMGLVLALVEKWDFITFLRKVFMYDFLFVDVLSMLWYVPAALILYLLFPPYYSKLKKAKNELHFTLISIFIWLVLNIILRGYIREDLYRFTNRIPIFLVGIFLGHKLYEGKITLNFSSWLILTGMLVGGVILEFMTVSRFMFLLVPMSSFGIPAFLIGISSTVLLAKLFSIICNLKIGSLFLKILSFFGSISLEIYCVQDLIDDTFRTIMMSTYEHWMENWFIINLTVFLLVVVGAFALSFISDRARILLNKIFSVKKVKT